MVEHEHDFGWPRVAGQIRFCQRPDCDEIRVMQPLGLHRPLTPDESFSVTCKMWEDLIVYDTMLIIHGTDRGPDRARYALGMPPLGRAPTEAERRLQAPHFVRRRADE